MTTTTAATTLSTLLFGDGSERVGEQQLRLQLPNLLDRRLPVAIGPIDLPSEVAAAIAALLTMPVGNLAVVAWNKHRQVRTACDRTARQADAREVVRLLEHTVRSEQRPTIELDVEGARYPLLTLTLQVEIRVSAADLVVERGRITGIQPATATASASLLAGDIRLATGALPTIDLGTIDLATSG